MSTTHRPATDLGFLLHKNPARAQAFDLGFGRAHVFYPEATEERCAMALLLEIDPVGLVRGRRGPEGEGGLLRQYVNDRPYTASSFLSVALTRIFRSAMTGQSGERSELAATPIALTARLAVLPSRGGDGLIRRLFEPLGYAVSATAELLDETIPEWGASHYHTVTLEGTKRVSEILTHLYVLVPVLDDEKHYWVGDDEVEKLLRHGEGWLGAHPERELITRRYLKHRHSLVSEAIARLVVEDDPSEAAAEAEDAAAPSTDVEQAAESSLPLHEQRLSAVLGVLRASEATSVLDLGCGEGKLLRLLLADRQFTRIAGMDVSHRSLEMASQRLRLDQLPDRQRERISLLHGSLTYRDRRLAGFDAAAVVEVIEHLDPPRLAAFERSVFEFARPSLVVLTTPNAEYNVRWPALPAGRFRHRDHRFEWSRAEFEGWAGAVAQRFGYSVRFTPLGPVDDEVGAPSQMAIFMRQGTSSEDAA